MLEKWQRGRKKWLDTTIHAQEHSELAKSGMCKRLLEEGTREMQWADIEAEKGSTFLDRIAAKRCTSEISRDLDLSKEETKEMNKWWTEIDGETAKGEEAGPGRDETFVRDAVHRRARIDHEDESFEP